MIRIATAAALAAMLAACGGGTEGGEAPKAAGQADFKVTGAGGATVAGGNQACAEKPDFVPILAGATITTCIATDTKAGEVGGSVGYTTPASPAEVRDQSRSALQASGLTIAADTETALSGSEPGKRSVAIIIAPGNGTTTVIANWTVSK